MRADDVRFVFNGGSGRGAAARAQTDRRGRDAGRGRGRGVRAGGGADSVETVSLPDKGGFYPLDLA